VVNNRLLGNYIANSMTLFNMTSIISNGRCLRSNRCLLMGSPHLCQLGRPGDCPPGHFMYNVFHLANDT